MMLPGMVVLNHLHRKKSGLQVLDENYMLMMMLLKGQGQSVYHRDMRWKCHHSLGINDMTLDGVLIMMLVFHVVKFELEGQERCLQ